MYWEKYSQDKIKQIIFDALNHNLNYRDSAPFGYPGSFLDPEVYYQEAPFLKESPYLSTLIANPNHIGCHSMGESEGPYRGTQQIEKEVIELCATQIFGANEHDCDGYVASGGTEANIEGFWVMRNYFMSRYEAQSDEMAIVYSEDSHYSMPKGANLLGLPSIKTEVDPETRMIQLDMLQTQLLAASKKGIKYLIVVVNMSTTMFGSVDPIDLICQLIDGLNFEYRVHVDAAYGGFIYPFSSDDRSCTFSNQKVMSISFDAHKMLQAPYGTGIFLIRKGFINYAMTKEANYVKGKDYTLIGSRSGANAIAVWMILRTYGSKGWKNKIDGLIKRTDWFCQELETRGIQFYRQPYMNIVTIRANQLPLMLMEKYHLVPDNYESPQWWKIVLMDHVEKANLNQFLEEIDSFAS